MNSAFKAALMGSKDGCFHLRTASFHSTPVLERKRRNHWQSRSFNHSKRFTQPKKETLLRNISAYTEFLFQRWQDENEKDDPSSSRGGPCWFKRPFSAKDPKREWTSYRLSRHWSRRGFRFCEEDDGDDVETLFRRAFGGNQFFYWSFTNEGNPQWRSSSNYNRYGRSWNWRRWYEETSDSSSESESMEFDIVSDRVALGLDASGPLKIEDVKNAYRACALKWHPDRHQGSSKAVAEEKFKHCSAAYQSLCDRLSLN